MFIAPWLMQGMGTFFGGVFQGQGVATSFSKAMTQMGTQATNAFNTVTGGIKGMFTKGVPTKAPVDLTTATTDLGNAIQKDSITKSIDFTKYSTDVMPNEYDDSNLSDDAVVEDVWHKTRGSHIPFIFSIDKDSEGDNSESQHIFARFAQNSLDMSQVALDTFNISMRIEEEF